MTHYTKCKKKSTECLFIINNYCSFWKKITYFDVFVSFYVFFAKSI